MVNFWRVINLKIPDGSSFTAVKGAVADADAQEVTHMVFYPRTHTYTKKEALREIKYRLKNTKYLKEVWVIWDGEIISLKK